MEKLLTATLSDSACLSLFLSFHFPRLVTTRDSVSNGLLKNERDRGGNGILENYLKGVGTPGESTNGEQ